MHGAAVAMPVHGVTTGPPSDFRCLQLGVLHAMAVFGARHTRLQLTLGREYHRACRGQLRVAVHAVVSTGSDRCDRTLNHDEAESGVARALCLRCRCCAIPFKHEGDYALSSEQFLKA